MTKADGTVVENVYDVDGVLVRTSTTATGGTAAVVNLLVDTVSGLSHVVAESDGSGGVSAYYVRAGEMLLEEIRGGDVRMYEADGLGSVRGLLDEAGTKTDTWGYTAFGESLSRSGADANPYGFAGERLDSTIGLYQNRARWMDTRAGAFLSMDPGRASESPRAHTTAYTYADNDPIGFSDSSGYFAEFAVVGITSSILHSIPEVPTVLSRDTVTITEKLAATAHGFGFDKGDTIAIRGRFGSTVGTLDVIDYSKVTGNPFGAHIRLGFNDKSSGLQDFRWIQTIRDYARPQAANDPTPLDGSAPEDASPFYWTAAENPSYVNVGGYDCIFDDTPSINQAGIIWRFNAELALVGRMSPTERHYRIITNLRWGYSLATNGRVSLRPIKLIPPSEFQRASVP